VHFFLLVVGSFHPTIAIDTLWLIDPHCLDDIFAFPPFTIAHSTWTTPMGHNLVLRFWTFTSWILTPYSAAYVPDRDTTVSFSNTGSWFTKFDDEWDHACLRPLLTWRKKVAEATEIRYGATNDEIRLTWCSTVHRRGSDEFRSRPIFAQLTLWMLPTRRRKGTRRAMNSGCIDDYNGTFLAWCSTVHRGGQGEFQSLSFFRSDLWFPSYPWRRRRRRRREKKRMELSRFDAGTEAARLV
jgi:hypothetical protein